MALICIALISVKKAFFAIVPHSAVCNNALLRCAYVQLFKRPFYFFKNQGYSIMALSFKKILLAGTALVAVSLAPVGTAHAQEFTVANGADFDGGAGFFSPLTWSENGNDLRLNDTISVWNLVLISDGDIIGESAATADAVIAGAGSTGSAIDFGRETGGAHNVAATVTVQGNINRQAEAALSLNITNNAAGDPNSTLLFNVNGNVDLGTGILTLTSNAVATNTLTVNVSGDLTANGGINFGGDTANTTLGFNGAAGQTVSGTVTGDVNGIISLNNAHTDGVTFNAGVTAGTLTFAHADARVNFNGATAITNAITIGANNVLTINGQTLTATGGITGGTGTLVLNDNNATVATGNVAVNTLTRSGAGASTMATQVQVTNLNVTGGDLTLNGAGSSATNIAMEGTSSLSGVALSPTNVTRNAGAGTSIINSVLTAGTVTVNAGGTLNLAGADTAATNIVMDGDGSFLSGVALSPTNVTRNAGAGTSTINNVLTATNVAVNGGTLNLAGAASTATNITMAGDGSVLSGVALSPTTVTRSGSAQASTINNVLTATTINVNDAGTLNIAGIGSTAGTVNMNAGAGTLAGSTSLGVTTLNGNAGGGNTGTVSLQLTGGTNVVVDSGTLNISNAASVIGTAGLGNNTLTFGGATIAGAVTGAGGTLQLSTAATTAANAAIGANGNNLAAVRITGTGTTTFGHADFYANALTFGAAGTANIAATTTTAAQAINFEGHAGTVIYGDNVSYTGSAESTGGFGTLRFGNNATVASVGLANGTRINTLDFTGSGSITNEFWANTVQIAAGTITANNAAFNAGVHFAGDGILNVVDNAVIGGNVTTASAGTGTLNFVDNLRINGNLDRLKTKTLVGDAEITGNAQAATTTDIDVHILTVGGSYTAAAGTALTYRVNTPTTSGKVVATGNAIVSTDAKVNMVVDTNVFVAQGQEFVLIDGANGGGQVAALAAGNLTTTSTALLNFKQDLTKTDDLVVIADRTQMSAVSSNSNNSAIGQMLDALGGQGDVDINALQVRLAQFTDPKDVDRVLATLVPSVGMVSSVKAQLSSGFSKISGMANTRLAALRSGDVGESGISAGNSVSAVRHLWAQVLGSKGDQDERGGDAGYKTDTWGMIAGMDRQITDQFTLGLAAAYTNTDVKGKDINSRPTTDVSSYQLMLYSNYDINRDTFLTGQMGFTYSDNDVTRRNVGGLANNVARGSFNVNQYTIQAALGRDLYHSRTSMKLTPSVSAHYSHIDFDTYTETGAGGLALSEVRTRDMNIFELGVNMRAEWDINLAHGGILRPNLSAGYTHDLIGDNVQTTARLVGGGAAFKNVGAEPERGTANVGAGLKLLGTESWEMTASYNYEFRKSYDAHSGALRVGVKF